MDPTPANIEQLRSLRNARPFKPFVIHLADGRSIPVMQCDYITTAPSGRTIAVYQPDDTLSFIDFRSVAELEMKHATTRVGKRRKG